MDSEKQVHNATTQAAILGHSLNTTLAPGTEVLTDVVSEGFVFQKGSSNVVLRPQPNPEDPHDPLNWTWYWKASTYFGVMMFTWWNCWNALSISSVYVILMTEFQITDFGKISWLTGSLILLLGFFNLLFVPWASRYGRRPVFLVSNLICCAAYLWSALSQSYGSLMGARILTGIGSAIIETLGPVVAADIFFVHQRAFYVSLYFIALLVSENFGIVVNGVMAESYGWRSFFWLSFATACFTQLVLIFGLPETKYIRAGDTSAAVVPTGGLTRSEEGSSTSSLLGKGKPGRKAFGIFPPADKSISVTAYFVNITKLCTSPIVLWGSFSFGFGASTFLAIAIIQSQLFAFPPYNFNSYYIGLTNISPAISQAIGSVLGGLYCDWDTARRARNNHGIHEAEMRLPSLIPFLGLFIAGTVLFAVGAQQGMSWPVVVVAGLGLCGVGLGGIPPVFTSYCVDSYKEYAGEYMMIATVIKVRFLSFLAVC